MTTAMAIKRESFMNGLRFIEVAQMNLEFFVKNQKITRKGLTPLVGDTAGFYTFTIDFDQAWDGLVKVVVFRNGADTAQMVYTGQSPLPAQVSGRGDLYVACHGYRQKGDAAAVLRTIRMTRPVRLLGSAPLAGDETGVFTPTVFDQVMAVVGTAQAAAERATALTKNLQQQWENGQFNGITPEIQIGTVTSGPEAQVTDVGDAPHVKLNFVLPKGDPGDIGPQGPRGETGPQGPVGTSLVVLDRYETLEALKAAHAAGGVGDAYAVGTEADNVIYLWGADTMDWVKLGSLQGPAGPQGATGATGPEGPQGEKGDTGAAGPAGADGKTPVKGTDYFTEADKQEIAQAAADLVEVPDGFSGSYNDLTDVPPAFTPAAHNQAASTITAGTFAGQVVANSNGQAAASYVVRNSKLASAEESPTVNGEICWKYE